MGVQAIEEDKVQAASSRGPISQLQEYVQEEGKLFRMPSNCSVLQWEFGTRMAGTNLEFRATVAFLLNGVPHHVAGVWKPSKKTAQRDAAERALGLYIKPGCKISDALTPKREEGMAPLHIEDKEIRHSTSMTSRSTSWADWTDSEQSDLEEGMQTEVDLLKDYCFKKGSPLPVWSYKFDGSQCQAFVEIKLLGVSHTFSGQLCDDEEMAEVDVAKRVLWYLQVPGLEDAFEPDYDYARAAAQEIPEPSTNNWVKDSDSEGEDKQLAERKTTIMRVQNRLQQAFARQLEAGTSVWTWQYERDRRDKQWPPCYRAVVNVPLANRSFSSDWIRGQREAQIDACQRLLEYLDDEFPRTRSVC